MNKVTIKTVNVEKVILKKDESESAFYEIEEAAETSFMKNLETKFYSKFHHYDVEPITSLRFGISVCGEIKELTLIHKNRKCGLFSTWTNTTLTTK